MKVWAQIKAAIQTHGCCALVTITQVKGSTPREAGARMVVHHAGFHGTIGGGTLEWQALARAQQLLAKGASQSRKAYPLGPELGQCCGGHVELCFDVFDAQCLPMVETHARREAEAPFWLYNRIAGFTEHFGDRGQPLLLFGAGHVGRALILALAPLPFSVRWVDPRPNAFLQAVPHNVTLVHAQNPIVELENAPQNSLVMIMSHSHALDLALCESALKNQSISHVGLIGSLTKRARFERHLKAGDIAEAKLKSLICPIGIAGISGKAPAVVALCVAAQLVQLSEALRAQAAIKQEHQA